MIHRKIPRSRKKGARRGRIIDAAYYEWLLGFPCLVAMRYGVGECRFELTRHHVKDGPGAQKNDYRAIPLCRAHHIAGAGNDAIHGPIGREGFEEKFGLNIEAEIERFNEQWRRSGHSLRAA